MKISKIQKGLVLLTITAGVFGAGCELIVDFDRTKIQPEVADAAGGDGAAPAEAGPGDAGPDAAETLDASDDAADGDAG
ncbi:MAG: hypothetical protein BGO98_47675 [Myxococcales bacterium 68-20]|nr:hypothetical protein [Myxococcales bacterium]OJY29535.1 MAG: hypothetical protein BGO98_47675 [Myxococcales bacterium 68-20]